MSICCRRIEEGMYLSCNFNQYEITFFVYTQYAYLAENTYFCMLLAFDQRKTIVVVI